MAYDRIKTVYGRRYRYIVEGKRIKGKVKQRVVKYLGPVDPIYKTKKKHRKNSRIFVRSLADDEKNILEKGRRSSDAFRRDRSRILLFSSRGLSSQIIADKLGCDVRKVRRAIKEFNEKGTACLKRKKAKGAEPKFTEETRKKILEHFSKDPKEFGYTFTAWTLPRFREHLIKQGVVDSICIETVRQMIMKAGARLTRSKRWQYSPDKDFAKKNKP